MSVDENIYCVGQKSGVIFVLLVLCGNGSLKFELSKSKQNVRLNSIKTNFIKEIR